MGVFGADASLIDENQKFSFENLAHLNEQPPFNVDIHRPIDTGSFFLTGRYDWDYLLKNPEKLKLMTTLDHLVVINQNDLDKMKNEEGSLLFPYDQEKIHEWLNSQYPEVLKMVNEEDLYSQEFCLETQLAIIFNAQNHHPTPAYAVPFNAMFDLGTADPSMAMIVMKDQSKWSQIFEMKDLNINLTKPVPPAILEEMQNITVVHELEHAIGQNNFYSYFFEHLKTQETGISDKDLNAMARHCMEIESDLAVYQKFEGLISEDTLNYFVALRNIYGFYQQMFYPHACDSVLDEHDTGLFIKEFQDTGVVPNYFHTCNTLEGFYKKTRDFYEEQYTNAAGKPPSGVNTPSLNVMTDIVRQMMKADPPIYTPAESQAAYNYINSMKVLGAEIESSHEYFQQMKAQNDMNMSPALQQQSTFSPNPRNTP